MDEVKQSVIQLRIQTKQFSSIEEVMAYPLTHERINHHVQELRQSRRLRPAAPAGMRYKKDAVDVMMDENELTTPFMIHHYADVHNKVSSIPGVRRNVMTHVCSQAIRDVLKSCEVIVKQGDKLNVKESKAKLTIVYVDQEKNEVKVEFKKMKEVWTIQDLINKLITKDIYQ